jgi:hypothetical protein
MDKGQKISHKQYGKILLKLVQLIFLNLSRNI